MRAEILQSPKAVVASIKRQLKSAAISYIDCVRRDGALSLDAVVPGERWEIDVLDDSSVEIEVFKSDGEIYDESKINELVRRFGGGSDVVKNGGTPVTGRHHKKSH